MLRGYSVGNDPLSRQEPQIYVLVKQLFKNIIDKELNLITTMTHGHQSITHDARWLVSRSIDYVL
jgi:hypothetical protein